MPFTVEKFTRIFEDITGAFWQVGEDRDSLGLCEIIYNESGDPCDRKNEKSLILPWDVAMALSKVLYELGATRPAGA